MSEAPERPIEPSDTDRAEWSTVTRQYVEYLEAVEEQKDAAVAAEREACARACADAAYDGTHPADDMAELGCLRTRDKIRARGNTDALAERDARIRAEALREAAGFVDGSSFTTMGYRDAILSLIPGKGKENG